MREKEREENKAQLVYRQWKKQQNQIEQTDLRKENGNNLDKQILVQEDS